MLNGKYTIIFLILGLIKKTVQMSEYFPKPKSLEANVKVELDLSNYAIKADLKNATRVDTSDLAKKTDLADLKSDVDKWDIDKFKNVTSNLSNLKTKVDELDIGKLETTLFDLSNLSNVVKNDVVKKTVYDKLVKKVNAIDIGGLVKKKQIIMLKSKILKIKYLVLLT